MSDEFNEEEKSILKGKIKAYSIRDESSKCWIWQRALIKGYGVTGVNSKELYAHRASHMVFNGDIPPGKLVMHSCDTPACVNPKHLKVGTARENGLDMVNKRRGAHDLYPALSKGMNNGRAILTEKQVIAIRKEWPKRKSTKDMANRYGVHLSTIVRAATNKRWKHI